MASRARLRRAEPADAPALVEIVQGGFETYRAFAGAGWEPPDERSRLEELREELGRPEPFCMVAEDGGAIVGHVLWLPAIRPSRDGSVPDVHLRYLFVLQPFWGTGIARDLLGAAVEEMRARQTGVARLYTPAGQARARRFYEREGWTLHDGPYLEPAMGLELVEYRLDPAG
jgi:GNAT superfamily N-acetyltransferase